MSLANFIFVLIAAFFGTFLRFCINNNFLISIIGSFFFGFIIAKRFTKPTNRILLSGFCSCFTSFSGFIYFLYELMNLQDYTKIFIYLNIMIVMNLFMMYCGFIIGRKIT